MTSTLIQGAQGIFTGLPGEAMRATGAIRIVDGRIAAIGTNLTARSGAQTIDASGQFVFPGFQLRIPDPGLQQGVALLQRPAVAAPDGEETRFHVEQAPVEVAAPVLRPASDQVVTAGFEGDDGDART